MDSHEGSPSLRRVISLPMLIFYGIGVTIGAGIFALSGEVIAISGDIAPWSFIVAGSIAGLTAVSYSLLSSDQPRAAGEAWFVKSAFGQYPGTIVGLLLVLTAILSSAAISVSFAHYMGELVSIPKPLLSALIIVVITLVAWKGVKETVIFAAVVTCIEVGTLLVVIGVGFPAVIATDTFSSTLTSIHDATHIPIVLSGAVVAFFAFIGFEDIVNMGEETLDAERNLPIAIIATLCVTLVIYVLVSLVCIAVPDRELFLQSDAPLAFVFGYWTDRDPWVISLTAAIAMVNGILVQVVMASRVLYGLAKSGALPKSFAAVNEKNRTPSVAIYLVSASVLVLALSFTLVKLAVFSSIILLAVFCAVNLSLWRIGSLNAESKFHRWSWWGLLAFTACLLLLCWQIWSMLNSSFG